MKIGTRLSIGFGLIIAITIIAGILTIYTMINLTNLTENMYKHPLTVGNAVRDIKVEILTMDGLLKNIIQSNNISQIRGDEALISNYEQIVNKNYRIVFDNFLGDLSAVEYSQQIFSKWEVLRYDIIKLCKQNERGNALNLAKFKNSNYLAFMLNEIDGLIDFAASKSNDFLNNSRKERKKAFYTIGGLLLVIIIVGLISAIFITRSIVLPLGIIVEKIKNLSRGNLKENVDIHSRDEVGKLANSFRELQSDLSQRAQLLEQIASGDFSNDIPSRSDDDDLGMSFFSMTSTLRETTEALLISENRFRGIVENMADWIWEIDTKGKYTYCSDKVENILGYSANEVIGKTPFDFMDPEEKEKVSTIFMEAVLEKKSINKLENWNITKKGKHICLMTSGTPILDGDGNYLGYRGVDSEITNKKKAEERLKAAKIEAESSNKAKSIFLANMSHELRTPLNAILGFSQILQLDKENLSTQQLENIGFIRESGEHLLGMVSDILDLSKIENDKSELQLKNLNIEEILGNTLIIIKKSCKDQNINLKLDLDDSIKKLEFMADSRKIKQIMYNLLSNAVKFTPENGTIMVEAFKSSSFLKVSVTDSGIGIEKEDQEKIFNKFFQAEGGIVNKTAGTGLGLNIVKNLVELHGGKLEVQSEGKNKGTSFSFSIPLKNNQGIYM